ncbi:alpha/beta hydrolase [Myroides ceti]|uniref:Alpha/beta hydrolase n=1 Tax=Paenimyroides ceti TaxID=395087 RepID=A0ABT8CYR7_9FLAO|nr:alpha/beta hydrolase [Paenimyroides ceti]MDN3708325.1 alpha/beta hydrolase [Paenimyroides ceti]
MNTFIYKNTTIYYKDSGKGNALIFLHGFLEDHTMWKNLATSFETKYRIISVDLLGHGQSGCLGYIHTMEDHADMLFSLLTELRLRKVSLIGHSMGGYIALAFAELYPDYVRNLVLINSSARADSEERKNNRDRAIEVVKRNSDAFIKMAISNLFLSEFQETLKKEIEESIATGLRTPVQGIIASLEGMKIREDREVLLHFGPYPKLMINGIHDTVIAIDDIKDQTVGTEVETLFLNGGHMSVLEHPNEVQNTLSVFLKKK